MPEVTDLMRVAQYVKSDRDAPSDVYNAACRMLDRHQGLREKIATALRGRYPSDDIRPSYRAADAVIAALSPPESHGDGRTPQTLGTPERQEATEAQEGSA